MQTFLKAWLAQAPGVLSRELAGELELRPSAQLPQMETATTLAIVPGGALQGRFLVTADRYALHTMFSAARVTDGSLDTDRDRELWCGILQQIAEVTMRAVAPSGNPPAAVDVQEATWTLGLPSAAWELRFGEAVLLLAFTDEIEHAETSSKEQAKEEVEAAKAPEVAADRAPEVTIPPRATPPPKVTPGGIDLLMDVELEASLRFGSREMPLSEVLDLGAGDVVELDRHVSDPVDLLVGDKIVARGEVVLVNGSFGLRVLEVAEPRKCLESIRCLF